MKAIDPVGVLQALATKLGSQRKAAKFVGISEPYFSDLVNRRRDPSDKVLEKLALRRAVVKDK